MELRQDGGWGWVVVLVCFFSHFMVNGIRLTFGVVYVFLTSHRERFGLTYPEVALVGSMQICLRLLLGGITRALLERHSCRSLMFAGFTLSSAGYALSCLPACESRLLFVTLAVFPGVGFSLITIPSLTSVQQYFVKKRSLAAGISLTGSTFGLIMFPPALRYALDNHGWVATLASQSVLLLLMSFASCLVYPYRKKFVAEPEAPMKTPRSVFVIPEDAMWCREDSDNSDVGSCSAIGSRRSSEDEIFEPNLSKPDFIEVLSSRLGALSVVSSAGEVALPDPEKKYMEYLEHSNEVGPAHQQQQQHQHQQRRQQRRQKKLAEKMARARKYKKELENAHLRENCPTRNKINGKILHQIDCQSTEIDRKQTETDCQSTEIDRKQTETDCQSTEFDQSTEARRKRRMEKRRSSKRAKLGVLSEREFSRQYEKQLHISSLTIVHNDLLTINMRLKYKEYLRRRNYCHCQHNRPNPCTSGLSKLGKKIKKQKKIIPKKIEHFLESSLLNKATVGLFVLVRFLWAGVHTSVYNFLPAFAQENGLSDWKWTLLLSVSGAGTIVSRPLFGWIGDHSRRRLMFYASMLLMSSIVCLSLLAAKAFLHFLIIAFLYGFASGGSVVLMIAALRDLVGMEQLVKLVGLLSTLGGVTCLIDPPLIGLMFEKTGSYSYAFLGCGLVYFLSAAVTFALFVATRKTAPPASSAVGLANEARTPPPTTTTTTTTTTGADEATSGAAEAEESNRKRGVNGDFENFRTDSSLSRFRTATTNLG